MQIHRRKTARILTYGVIGDTGQQTDAPGGEALLGAHSGTVRQVHLGLGAVVDVHLHDAARNLEGKVRIWGRERGVME